jgi:hypothetical protein
MPRGTIKIRIEKNGDTTVETKGFKGRGCLAATKKLEEALGTVVSSKPTKEMFERKRLFRKIRQKNGTYKRIYLDRP